MFVSTLLRPKSILALVLTFAIASIAYGFAAANTMPDFVSAGDGNVAVSGYTIADVEYTYLTVGADATIDQVSFTLAGDVKPATARVQLIANGAWFDAPVTGTESPWTATTATGLDVDVTTSLLFRVVAGQ